MLNDPFPFFKSSSMATVKGVVVQQIPPGGDLGFPWLPACA